MISHEHKCIFVHQRKCAGVTISRMFGYTDDTVAHPSWCYMNDGVLSPEYHTRPPDYFNFAIVRNPWDRFISGWLFLKGTHDVPLKVVLQNLPKVGYDYAHLTRLQRDTLYDHDGRLIVDYLMRFEKLQDDWNHVSQVLSLPRTNLLHINRLTGRRPYQDYFDDSTKDLFLKHFGRDVDTFGYKF